MTEVIRRWKLKGDESDTLYDAVRYGNENLTWDPHCIPRVAQFMLGLDTESRVSVSNEHIMDVVQPVPERWTPEHMVADIRVANWAKGTTYQVRLGDWILRDDKGEIFHVGNGEFRVKYEEHLEYITPRTVHDDLSDLIYAHMPWEGDIYRAAAARMATSIMTAGWSKR